MKLGRKDRLVEDANPLTNLNSETSRTSMLNVYTTINMWDQSDVFHAQGGLAAREMTNVL